MFETSDVELVAYLMTAEQLELENYEARDGIVWFSFRAEDAETCRAAQTRFLRLNPEVQVRDFLRNLNWLRKVIRLSRDG